MSVPKPSLLVRLWMRYRYWKTDPFRAKSRSTIADKFQAGFTLVLAVIGGLQLVVYLQQKEIMQSSTHQTNQLICAARIQASAATSFSTSAESINIGIKEAVDRLGKNAGSMAALANQTTDFVKLQQKITRIQYGGAQVNVDDWTGWYRLENPIDVLVTLKVQNVGQQDGHMTGIAQRVAFRRENPTIEDFKFVDKDFGLLKEGVLQKSAFAYSRLKLSEQQNRTKFPDTGDSKTRLYVWGAVRFSDFTQQGIVEYFCRYIPPEKVLQAKPGDPDDLKTRGLDYNVGYAQIHYDCPRPN